MDTRNHFVSIDSADDLEGVPLTISLTQDGAVTVTATQIEQADVATDVPNVDELDPPETGETRWWWTFRVGPAETLDPTGLPQPLIAYGELTDDPETFSLQWVIGDPEPDELPQFSDDCWPVSIVGKDVATWDDFPADVQELAKASAVATLRALTGYSVGGCTVVARPCRAGCTQTTWRTYPVGGSGSWSPVYVDGTWLNIGCGVQHGRLGCRCRGVAAVDLPPPVGRVDEVWINGAILDASAYRLVSRTLIRTDGELWPLTQDLSQPYDGDEAFSIVYLPAWPVDGQGSLAAGVLAVEYGKLSTTGKCRLPANATQVQRAGVTVQLDKRKQSQTAAFPDGLTGIREVDAFITRWNPNGLRTPSSVWSPDLAGPIR